MNLVVITDAYPPMKTSGAVQIRDLVTELVKQGHQITVFLPDATLSEPWLLEEKNNVTILRLKSPVTKDVNYFRRAIGEYLLSFFMHRNLGKSPLKDEVWEGLIWYSPTIFFGPLVKKIKRKSNCLSYLILRDIFPEWAVDMGILRRGLIYKYFKKVERYQYAQANIIGVQTSSNLNYFSKEQSQFNGSIEVLNNWLSVTEPAHCSILLSETHLAGRIIFIYTGNIGIAQGMDILIDLAKGFEANTGVGFVFVGRGTALQRIKDRSEQLKLNNILFFDEIHPDEIPGLFIQSHIGLLALDPKHRNDNIPGKFLAYMQAGLPVLANINAGNDLERIINENDVGKVVSNNSIEQLTRYANEMVEMVSEDIEKQDEIKMQTEDSEKLEGTVSERCRQVSASLFSSETAATQIIQAFSRASTK